jgi:HEAT repeat protein
MRYEEIVSQLQVPDVDNDRRMELCRELTHSGDPRVDVLLDLLARERDSKVRFEIVYCLGELGDPRAFEPFCAIIRSDKDAALRGLAAERIALFENVDAVPVLIEALDDGDPRVRFDAAWSLQTVGDERAKDALARHVDEEDRPYESETIGEIARAALQALDA